MSYPKKKLWVYLVSAWDDSASLGGFLGDEIGKILDLREAERRREMDAFREILRMRRKKGMDFDFLDAYLVGKLLEEE